MDYPPREIVDMIKVVGLCGGNFRATEREYARIYPNRRHPCKKTIKRLLQRAEMGSLKRKRKKTAANNVATIVTLAEVLRNPHISSRQIERLHGVSQRTCLRILKEQKFHPYHIVLTHKLDDRDFDRRLQFCNWAQNQLARDPFFFSRVLFTDESTFNNRGGVNRHNCHYWSEINPHWQRSEEFQHQWSLNVWAGIIGNCVIGPYFFEENLNGETYLTFLQHNLPCLLENVTLEVRRDMWFQQDGAPAHRSRHVVNYLNNQFQNRWIGIRNRIQEWPPRSPDLTPLDFFLWGYVKEKVFATKPTTVNNMKIRIRNAFSEITPDVLQKVQESFRLRLMKCAAVNGNLFEHLP